MNKIIFISVLFLSTFAKSDWTPNKDSHISLERNDSTFEVKKDGSYTLMEERQFLANNEQGRNALALEKIIFSPDTTKVEIIKAVSITDGIETAVDLKTIQLRTAPGPQEGITGLQELIIPFTNLKIGSRIKYQMRETSKKVLTPGVFNMLFHYGIRFPEIAGSVKIISERKINYAATDNEKNLSIQTGMEGAKFTLQISLIKPANRKLADEGYPIYNEKSFAQVHVSTAENWAELAKNISKKYEAIIAQELPPSLKEIAEKAKQAKDFHSKIDITTSELASIITYSGNWTSLDKMYYPQGLSLVGSKKTGDCKDFATTTVAILRSIGIEASVAMTYRKNPYDAFQRISSQPIDPSIAIPLFNHAIVRVVSNEGKVFWVDPTNATSNSRYAFSDISGSYALNLSPNTKEIEKIPTSDISMSELNIKKSIKILSDETGETKGTLTGTGTYAVSSIETAFLLGQEKAQDSIIALYGLANKEAQRILDTKNSLNKRISTYLDVNISTSNEKIFFEKEQNSYILVPLPRYLELYFSANSPSRKTDFYFAPQSKVKSSVSIQGYDFEESKDSGCIALSPWFDVERKLFKNASGFEVQDEVHFKKELIEASEINNIEFTYALLDLQRCINSQTIQVKKLGPKDSLESRLSKFTIQNIQELNFTSGPESAKKGQEAKMMAEHLLIKSPSDPDLLTEIASATISQGYRSGYNYGQSYLTRAHLLLDRSLAIKPDHLNSLVGKSYALLREQKIADAKTYFSKSYVASKEKNFRVYLLAGSIFYREKKLQLALNSYLKALDFAKNDRQKGTAYASSAYVYNDMGNLDKAEELFNLSLQKKPSDAWLLNDLVSLYIRKSSYDKAIEFGLKMLSIADFGVGRKNLAYAYCAKAIDTMRDNASTVKQFEEAQELSRKGLKWFESPDCLSSLARSYHGLGKSHKDIGSVQKAIDAWEKFGKIREGSPQTAATEIAQLQKLIAEINEEQSRMPASKNIKSEL